MKFLIHPVPIACALIAVLGAVLGQVPMVVLGLVAAVASIGLLAARRVQEDRSSGDIDSLSMQSRSLARPVKKLADDIEEIVSGNQTSDTVRIMGSEALNESRRLLDQVVKSLSARDQLRRALEGKYEADKDIATARMRLEHATDAEKASLDAAIEARSLELQHYAEIEGHIKRIDVGVSQAEAALAEMKARLTVTASGEDAANAAGDDLRESLARMKSLSAGYDEAEQLLKGS